MNTFSSRKQTSTATVITTSEDRTGDSTIPSGFIHGSIAVKAGQITINGAVYDGGDVLDLPPMYYGNNEMYYDDYNIVVTGGPATTYRVHFVVP